MAREYLAESCEGMFSDRHVWRRNQNLMEMGINTRITLAPATRIVAQTYKSFAKPQKQERAPRKFGTPLLCLGVERSIKPTAEQRIARCLRIPAAG